MKRLLEEIHAMQNPALGATLLWRFVCGYSPKAAAKGTPIPLVFVVLPLVFHAKSEEALAGTQAGSGIRKLEQKFEGRGDTLLAIQPRMLSMRELSLRSLRIGLRAGLLTLVPSEAVLWPRSYSAPPVEGQAVASLLRSAEKLGAWCSDVSVFEVAGILKVEF